MSSFDPMAAAIDWLDTYRAGALSIDDLGDAPILCGCGGEKRISGPHARRAYWASRFVEKPAGGLVDIEDRGETSWQLPIAPWEKWCRPSSPSMRQAV